MYSKELSRGNKEAIHHIYRLILYTHTEGHKLMHNCMMA